jgi:hypothetical protein
LFLLPNHAKHAQVRPGTPKVAQVLVFPIPAIPKPVFRYSGLFNTGKYRKNFAGITGIRTYKMGTFDQNYYLLKNILSNIHLIYFGFTCKPAFILAYLSKKKNTAF